jgi:Protein of unknown function (DUF3383)
MTTIPYSVDIQVNPGVISAGGANVTLNGLLLSTSYRVPIGTIETFNSSTAVEEFFGAQSNEFTFAEHYFAGYDNSQQKPGALLVTQYPQNAVSAYLEGGNVSSLTITQLQAFSGSLSITIDGTPQSASINLSAATSFSNAAEIIASGLGIKGVAQGNYEASLSGTVMTVTATNTGPQQASVTASLNGTVMTVSAISNGFLAVGQLLTGTGITAGTTIQSFGTGAGGVGTYNLSAAATTEAAEAISAFSPNGNLAVGQVVTGTGLTANTYIASLGTGTGGAGTYNLSISATTESSEAVQAFSPAVTYDSLTGAFFIFSGSTGVNSSMSFGTGTLATNLLLTSTTGATLSQGAAPATPAAFMASIVAQNANWKTFSHDFNMDVQGGITNRLALSQFNALQNNAYLYVTFDSDLGPTTQSTDPTSLAQAIITAGFGGTSINWEPSNLGTAAFVMGAAASLDFTQTDGRTTFKYLSQSGLTPGVTALSVYNNLTSNGYNTYGAYGEGGDTDQWYANGTVSGQYNFLDSYVIQLALNSSFVIAIKNLFRSAGTIPYNAAGRTQIAAGLSATIQQFLAFGAYVPGVQLSPTQISQVNNLAGGMNIANTLMNQGWYLLVGVATAAQRQARQSPPCTFLYVDGQSVQSLTIQSLAVL